MCSCERVRDIAGDVDAGDLASPEEIPVLFDLAFDRRTAAMDLGHVEKGFGDSGVRAGSLKTAPNVWTENEQRAARAVIAV